MAKPSLQRVTMQLFASGILSRAARRYASPDTKDQYFLLHLRRTIRVSFRAAQMARHGSAELMTPITPSKHRSSDSRQERRPGCERSHLARWHVSRCRLSTAGFGCAVIPLTDKPPKRADEEGVF